MSRRKRPKLRLCLVFAHGKILLPFSGWEPRGTVPKLGSFLDPFCQLRGMVFLAICPGSSEITDVSENRLYNYMILPVVPHKAVAEVSKIGNL